MCLLLFTKYTHNFFVWRYNDQIYCYDRADGCFEVQVFIFAEIYHTTDLTGQQVFQMWWMTLRKGNKRKIYEQFFFFCWIATPLQGKTICVSLWLKCLLTGCVNHLSLFFQFCSRGRPYNMFLYIGVAWCESRFEVLGLGFSSAWCGGPVRRRALVFGI